MDIVVRESTGETVRRIAGRTIGQVPKVISGILLPAIDSRKIRRSTAFYTGGMVHRDHPTLGKGPKLECMYCFETDSCETITNIISEIGRLTQVTTM